MDNLIFSLNATIPVFLMMVLGYFFNKIGWIDDEFASKINSSSVYRFRCCCLVTWRRWISLKYGICGLCYFAL